MQATPIALRDDAARAMALSALDRSFLVEAGAGSGKTAVMAGRVAMLLAGGAAPASIAAVTFTELAAGELLQRVRAFVDALVAGQVPPEMAVALPHGLGEDQRRHLAAAASTIDQLTCSTIHGFCQRLIMPYPVEADIDPGAAVIDSDHANQVLDELGDQWLWSELDAAGDSLLAQLVARDPVAGIALVRAIAAQVGSQRGLVVAPAEPLAPLVDAFIACCAALDDFVAQCGVHEEETARRAACFTGMARQLEVLTGLAALQGVRPDPELCTAGGGFLAFQAKGKWREAARLAGLQAADGVPLFDTAGQLIKACQQAWTLLEQEVAAAVLAELVAAVRPLTERFARYKREAALLDFDDLIHAARDLLRDHDEVRAALGQRYRHVLVDEFQDTDPLQSEIFWRLCGDAGPGVAGDDWRGFTIRPGALFLVGDPKQAIYRFRGADIAAFNAARGAFAARGDVLSIATNFRSCAPILDFVNRRFEARLAADGQPGFTRLDAFHAPVADQVCVAALDVAAASADGKVSAEGQRDAEAEAVADMCAAMIGKLVLPGRHGATGRTCRAGDIALLAPTGGELWRYEEALELRGIAVATQAGKGFYRRQEVQDLIALCRVLADGRDTIALGALLRGPLVGLSEEALLDIVCALPPDPAQPDGMPRLGLHVDAAHIANETARTALASLQALRRRAHATTPHLLLAAAVEAFQVRPILMQRHHGRAERALANVDKFLGLSQGYAAQGLAAFAAAMTRAWTDAARAPEGQPDAQDDAVTLYTMHAAKGLEWPVVVPINTMTKTVAADSVFCERSRQRLCCPVFGVKPAGYVAAHEHEAAELGHERIRLWYVAATRARELLVLPRLDVAPAGAAWMALLDLGLADLPALELDEAGASGSGPVAAQAANTQTRDQFVAEAAAIAVAAPVLRWCAPSRAEGDSHASATLVEETAEARIEAADEAPEVAPQATVQGGRERGLVMHKLFEEVLTGETDETPAALQARAATLIAQLCGPASGDPRAPMAGDIAGCVERTLCLPEIAALRPGLAPEFSVHGALASQAEEVVTAGIADAIAFGGDGQPEVVVDWKSDVAPTEATLLHYRAQVGNYLALTGAPRGLIVLATSGRIIEVRP
ncbi:UvrD-helicase domain-containing protein [Telluria beijingensis]|uniref:UvrD-helicase domain-containing protein n=1 Tax=Telluria beijingensis TaxID=3068633 RepID=UPI002795F3FE|nr:UvrD-helicase domain-containing protein [Massilia sp. REN29]